MEPTETDKSLIAAVFEQAALRGWSDVSIADAARAAGVPLGQARARFPGRGAVLLRFGVMADQAALANVRMAETPRERLFDMLMSRFDVLQSHRPGILALMAAVRLDPGTGLLLYGATLRSMKWLLDGAGIPSGGVVGALRVHGLMALWLYAVRAWEADESADLSATMAAVDRGLDRAIQAENMLPGHAAPAMAPQEGQADVYAASVSAAAVPDEAGPRDPGTPVPPPASDLLGRRACLKPSGQRSGRRQVCPPINTGAAACGVALTRAGGVTLC